MSYDNEPSVRPPILTRLSLFLGPDVCGAPTSVLARQSCMRRSWHFSPKARTPPANRLQVIELRSSSNNACWRHNLDFITAKLYIEGAAEDSRVWGSVRTQQML